MRTSVQISAVLLCLSLSAACGGGLKYHVDDAALTSVPAGDQQAVLTAKGRLEQVNTEVGNAKSEVGTDDRDVSVAESEYGQAKLEVDKAEAESRLAEQSKDVNRVQGAAGQLKLARLGKQVADAKTDWLKQRRKWHRAQLDAAEQRQRLEQANVELEKARLAQQNKIRPSADFNVANFEQQALNQQSRLDQKNVEADRQKLATTQAEARYNQLAGQYAQQRGAAAPAAPGAMPETGT